MHKIGDRWIWTDGVWGNRGILEVADGHRITDAFGQRSGGEDDDGIGTAKTSSGDGDVIID